MKRVEVLITNKVGLHARPASEFSKTASKFKSEIIIEHKNKHLNAKSILNILSAGIQSGSTISIIADGEDEEKAIDNLAELVNSNFGE
ncbi:HPr family phosphocarrier protein [Petroclostridium sp. X23]|uniref:HPr family phosphocarrier protein n=1 Tax=Petroclostridium sp. X23 TaxID=3045146 RepID=UPI0024AE3C6F|nr:HPr family phosphocarrier protein [Petroclostridium sp. X23]WHH60511.1 HPr family phosphocarrier protein [Petroclostridium sp. X23]